jgi:hypothetical protein
MKPLASSIVALAVCICFTGSMASAQNRKAQDEQETFLDAQSAGPDFPLQGEYVGELAGGKGKIGAQIIAMGDGRFSAVFLNGGLPGEGWDGTSRAQIDGQRRGDQVTFHSEKSKWEGTISGGKLSGKTESGEAFSLQRIERVSPDEGEKPPAGATVLFDGTNTDAWEDAHVDSRKLLQAGTKTKHKYQDFKLHVEFLIPFKPKATGQERGNSGIYIQDRYEVQVLDTFGHPPEFNGAASTYRQTAPKINMSYPPLRWQTYDIDFTAAKFDSQGKKTKNAVVTVRYNGVVVQDHTELTNKTGAGKPEGPQPGPIQLQGHGNPVFFRNIWITEKN